MEDVLYHQGEFAEMINQTRQGKTVYLVTESSITGSTTGNQTRQGKMPVRKNNQDRNQTGQSQRGRPQSSTRVNTSAQGTGKTKDIPENRRCRCYEDKERYNKQSMDQEIKLEEIEDSLTLGGSGEGRVQGRGKCRGCRCSSGVKHCNTVKNI